MAQDVDPEASAQLREMGAELREMGAELCVAGVGWTRGAAPGRAWAGLWLETGSSRGPSSGDMAGIKALVLLSFSGAIGLTFLMLGCALEDYGVYWPLFVLIFHAISPIPHFIAKRATYDSDATSSACRELAYFFTTGIVVSAFGFPVILARVAVIKWGACGLVLAGNAVIFLTIQGFFLVFGRGDDFSWEQW
ncbi:unnamed protein product [Pipistrellus nathusii]